MPLRELTQLRVSISSKEVLFIRASLAALEVRSKPEASACPAPDPFGNECQERRLIKEGISHLDEKFLCILCLF